MNQKKFAGENAIKPEKKISLGPDLAADPGKRLCPKFDCTGMARQDISEGGRTGPQVLDNCAEEHIQ